MCPLYLNNKQHIWQCVRICPSAASWNLAATLVPVYPKLTFWLSAAGPWIRQESLDPLRQTALEYFSPANQRSGSGAWASQSESLAPLRAWMLGSPARQTLQSPTSLYQEQRYLSPSAGQMTCSGVMMLNWQSQHCLNLYGPLSLIFCFPYWHLWWSVNHCWWFVL